MKKQYSKTVGAWVAISAITLGCGPFFPDSLLNHPQAALAVPAVSYLHGLHKMAGTPIPQSGFDNGATGTLLDQIPLELAELEALWKSKGVDEKEIVRLSGIYREVRTTLLRPLTEVSMRDFPTHLGGNVGLPPNPLGDGFPKEVADYVEAARLQASGKTDEARELWKDILGRPAAEKRLRSLWSAWMLAKTSAKQEECMDWYARVEEEAKLGGTDVLGLRAAAKSWRGPRAKDPVESIRLLYESFSEGRETAAMDLRAATAFLLSSKDPAVLDAAAADPVVRRLVNLDLHAVLDNRGLYLDQNWKVGSEFDPWFAALEKQGAGKAEDAAWISWALYACGRYEESRKWLSLAVKDDALALWLQAKFDLRDGDTKAAGKNLAEALRLRSSEADWDPANHYSESQWFDGVAELQSLNDGRLLAENGVLSLAQGEYAAALESLRNAGYWSDAAYVAENVLSTNALVAHVRKVAPEWKAEPGDDAEPGSRRYGRGSDPDNRLRWVLARRLNREKRFKEAREFISPDLAATLDRYSALDTARRSGKYAGEKQAAIAWEQALMHRHFGAELFSTEAGPDGGAYGWNFPMASLVSARTRKDGWVYDYDGRGYVSSEMPEHRAIPAVSPDEMVRTRRNGVKIQRRFHYRYGAADLAWEAGKSLPANHPLLAQLYTTAGFWLAPSDPEAADRFYQALVRRCPGTAEGKAADENRWFSSNLGGLDSMEALPPELRRDPKAEPPW
jgi:hypothetical protein